MLTTGDMINETYMIDSEIGSGALGVVYRAYHVRLQKYVVLKKIKVDKMSYSRFRIEVDTLKQLRHAYLPNVYDYIESDGNIYTVMDYISGYDLKAYMESGTRFTEQELIKWLRQLADYGNTFVIGEKDGYLVTTPLSLEEMKLLVRSVASDNPDSAFGEKTSDKSAGESPRQKKKVSRVDFFADNKKLFFMAWLVALVVHSIRSGEGFGFETVVRGFFFSAFFCFVSFAVGFLILVGLKILLHYHPKISRAICKVTVYISAVTFVLRMMTDIYVEKWGEGVVARSSFSLGTLFAALALYSMYYRGKDGEDYCAQKASEKEWQPVNVVRSGMKDSDRERRAFYPREHAARIFDELKKRAVLPCLKISADAVPEDEPLSLTASKFGGYPYWQEGIEYPTAKDDGTKLVLLAQINFEEISRLNFPLLQSPEFADFPKSGILQFFVKPDEHYGCEFFKINQDKWRAVFHEKVGEPLSKEALRFRGVKSAGDLYETDGACLPLYNEFALSFDAGESFINERCEELLVSAVRRIAAELRFIKLILVS